MTDRSRLEWVANNRNRPEVAKPIGSHVVALVRALEERALPVESVASCLAELVDAEFREVCRVESLERGVLRIGVGDVSATAGLARKWSGRLRAALPPKLKIKRIAFAYGTRGHRIH